MLVCEILVIGFQREKYFSTLTPNCQQGNDNLRNLFRGERQNDHNNYLTQFLCQHLDYEQFMNKNDERLDKVDSFNQLKI